MRPGFEEINENHLSSNPPPLEGNDIEKIKRGSAFFIQLSKGKSLQR